MKETSKREQFDSLRKLAEIGPRVPDGEISVVEDIDSLGRGPDPERAAVTKAMLDTLNDRLQPLGLAVVNANLGWNADQSAEQIYDRLRGMRLISDDRSLPNLFSV